MLSKKYEPLNLILAHYWNSIDIFCELALISCKMRSWSQWAFAQTKWNKWLCYLYQISFKVWAEVHCGVVWIKWKFHLLGHFCRSLKALLFWGFSSLAFHTLNSEFRKGRFLPECIQANTHVINQPLRSSLSFNGFPCL